ncbi:MAG TPA: hypothetical protein VFH38_08390 [Jatrophihabitans sp.]|nr:hypothetical protein [Jatrophihabitans sp.]
MFARSSTIYAQAPLIDTGIAHVRDTVMPRMSHVDGFVGLSLMVDRESGRCIATSAWLTEQAMQASRSLVDDIRADAAKVFGGPAQVEEWHIAVLHRAHHARPGTCMRTTWTRTDPSRVDAAVDSFKFETIRAIEDLPGFCSASLLVNQTDGRAVVTVGYDSRHALELSRRPALDVRETGARQAAVEVLDVGEFDLELAHLHVPELV